VDLWHSFFGIYEKIPGMKNKNNKPGKPQPPGMDEQEQKRDKTFPGYPTYPPKEDIMNQGEKEELDVEKMTRSARLNNEMKAQQKAPDEQEELDVPGAELDDRQESIGEEDEENNFYSLGGERHEDLEEDPS